MDLVEAKRILEAAWPNIVDECRMVLGGELHYQAVVYHCLRNAECPARQIGMNVKQWITDPVSELFQQLDVRKNEAFRGGFEPIPDVVLFKPEINGNWQRRNFANTLRHMLCAIEVKASERAKARLTTREVKYDIAKLAAHRDEVAHRGGSMFPVMMVLDVAGEPHERMREDAVYDCAQYALHHGVAWMFASPEIDICTLDNGDIAISS